MLQPRPISSIPSNFQEFTCEISEGLAALYGEKASQDYLRQAHASFQATLEHPFVTAYAVQDGNRAVGLLFTVVKDPVGRIPFFHVLQSHAETEAPRLLTTVAVNELRGRSCRGIVCECIPMGPAEFGAPFVRLGFRKVHRLLLDALIMTEIPLPCSKEGSRPSTGDDRNAIGGILADAYRTHPDHPIHPDLHDARRAAQFVNETAQGYYGYTRPEYLRVVEHQGAVAGVILGCEVAPYVGFVLQVTVRPEFQNQGIGSRLLVDLLREFSRRRMRRVALCVTETNPARRLYERIGFRPLREFDAYFWYPESS